MTVKRKDYTFEEILLLLEMEPFRSESTGYRLLEMQERIDVRDIEIIRLKNQLTTLLDAVTYDWSETPECNVSAGRRLEAAIQSSIDVLEVTR